MWSCRLAMSPANQTCWRGPRKALFTWHRTGYVHVTIKREKLALYFVNTTVTLLSLPPIHWCSWCLWTVTPRTAWVQLCFPIIWWKAAALSSLSLQPTTLKGHCQQSLAVCSPLLLLINGCCDLLLNAAYLVYLFLKSATKTELNIFHLCSEMLHSFFLLKFL